MDDELTEYDALLYEYGISDLTERDKQFIQWTMMQLGVRMDAPAGTAKHHLQAYDKMMKTALPIFEEDARRSREPYTHIPFATFSYIDKKNPDK